jgi:5-oxoprolinase (ATP-hydrolysing) subunit C
VSTQTLDVIAGGAQTTVQDWPGRRGRLSDGFAHAGPMDDLAFRSANRLVGNPPQAAGLEITFGGLRVRFQQPTVIAICGTDCLAALEGVPVPPWEAVAVGKGDELRMGMARGPGARSYLAVAGGIDVPVVFGSRATHLLSALGGHEGRALKRGDRLAFQEPEHDARANVGLRVEEALRPAYAQEWTLDLIPGPQAVPDFLTEDDLRLIFSRPWAVQAASNRVGLRLEPFGIEWARSDGGIAGGHPSNVLENGYPVGGLNFNGDTPVLLGPDGPTAGGLAIVATVARASMWKLGQIRPGADRVRFAQCSVERAVELGREHDERIDSVGLERG